MRYALRNQNKIKQKLGDKYLKELMRSLDYHFLNNETIEELDSNKTKFKVIHVKSGNKTFEFVKIKQTYDVYNLAYYGEV